MSETLFALVADYGLAALAASCFLSCLLLPIPSSLLMLTGGAFAATGDLALWQVLAASWGAAVLGDNAGYMVGRANAGLLDRLAARGARRAMLIGRARRLVARRGGLGVFFSTWLVAPLGPYVNMIAGAAPMRWIRFASWDAAGEMVWVVLYVGTGYVFAANLDHAAEVAGDLLGLLAAGSLAIVLGVVLFRWLLRGEGEAH